MKRRLALAATVAAGFAPVAARASAAREWHHRARAARDDGDAPVVLTFDACGGGYDAELIALLAARRVPATLFVTRLWLDRQHAAARELLARPELFELENHGTRHVPAIVAPHGTLYGMAPAPDVEHLRAEVLGGAERIRELSGRTPRYFRGAGAAYDETGARTVEAMDFRIAGFSVNADAGASLPAASVAARLRAVRPGDIVIAHMNRPGHGTAAGFAQALPGLQQRGLRFARLSEVELVRVP